LTPYTSFLADDNPATPLATRAIQLERARNALGQLDEAEGVRGFAQRAEKKALREAGLPSSSTAKNGGGFGGGEAAPGFAKGLSGLGGPGGKDGGKAAGEFRYFLEGQVRDLNSDKSVPVDSLQVVGNETLYKRGTVWIAASAQGIDPDKDAAKIKTIERFSDDYFKLTAANTPAENAVFANQQNGEELLIKLRGEVYRIK
jgi:hypothetical protein